MTQSYSAAFLDKHRDINLHDCWWHDTVYEDFRQICTILGIELDSGEPSFSGFWSQGDGASWTGRYQAQGLGYAGLEPLYTYDLAPAKIRKHAPQDEELHRIADELCLLARIYGPTYAIVRRHSHHYVHSNTMCVSEWEYHDDEIDINDVDDKIIDHIEEALLHAFQALADWLYKTLEAEHDYLTSDEAVIGTLEANEIEEEQDEDEDEDEDA
jgi:hypothetical protein